MPTRPPTHRPPGWRPWTQTRSDYDRARPTPAARGYDAEWRAFRAGILAQRTACQACGSTDRLNVDHIETVREAPARRLDPTNVRVLCQSCHSARTSRDHSWNGRR